MRNMVMVRMTTSRCSVGGCARPAERRAVARRAKTRLMREAAAAGRFVGARIAVHHLA